MKRPIVAIIMILLLAVVTQAQDEPRTKPVPEKIVAEAQLHQKDFRIFELEVQNLQMQIDAMQRQMQARQVDLQSQRTVLEERIVKEADAPKGSTVDWTKLLVVWPKKE